MAGREAAAARVLRRREQLPDGIERLEIGDRIAARRAPDRRLIHQHRIGDELGALDRRERAELALSVDSPFARFTPA